MLRYFIEKDRLQRFALVVLILIIILGMFFLVLNILDINEDYLLNLPINIFNNIFITALAIPLIYLSVNIFTHTGSPRLLALGAAQMALGIGSLLKGWLPNTSLDILVILYESILVLTSLIYLVGAIMVIIRPDNSGLNSRKKIRVVTLSYASILIIISIIVLLVFRGVIPAHIVFRENTVSVQNVMQIISILLLFTASFIFFRISLLAHSDLSHWYFLGVLSLSFGVFFMAQGPVESKIAWAGRASQYFGNICFLIAVIRNYKEIHNNMDAGH